MNTDFLENSIIFVTYKRKTFLKKHPNNGHIGQWYEKRQIGKMTIFFHEIVCPVTSEKVEHYERDFGERDEQIEETIRCAALTRLSHENFRSFFFC